MKFFKKYQIVLTILIIVVLIIEFVRYKNEDITKTIEGYLVCGLLLYMVTSLFVIGIYASKHDIGFNNNRFQAVILVVGLLLEISFLSVVCLTLEDKIKLREFKEIGYTKATARVVNVYERTKHVSDGERTTTKTVYDITWSYDGHRKTEEGSKRNIGDTKTIYYSNADPKKTRWSISESVATANVCGILIIFTRLANYYSTFMHHKLKSRKKEPNDTDDPIKEV